MFIVISVMAPLQAFAQSLVISKSPQFPKEGELLTITISSFSFDLKNSLVTWKQGKEVLSEGIGTTSIIIPNAKNKTIVVEVVQRETGEKLVQGIPIITSQVDLLWEAVGSYTPPFYKGKALPPLEANINVVAFPKRNDISELFYSWQKEYSSKSAQSGRSKNSFSYLATPFEQANAISVEISSPDGSYKTQDDLIVRYGNSEVVFYENDSKLGILYNSTIKNNHKIESDKEISLVAVPYFVTTDTIDSKNLEMVWAVNGNKLPTQQKKNKIRLTGATGISGDTIVSVFIKNTSRLFEEGNVGVSLNF